jgi:hypothetical protein
LVQREVDVPFNLYTNDPHYYVYIEARLGPYDSKLLGEDGSPSLRISGATELKHAASFIRIEHSDGVKEVYKDKRAVRLVSPPSLEWSDDDIEVIDAVGHLSTGGDRIVNEDLLRRIRALLERCHRGR